MVISDLPGFGKTIWLIFENFRPYNEESGGSYPGVNGEIIPGAPFNPCNSPR